MEYKKIIDSLAQISGFVEQWQRGGALELERDSVLRKIAELYEQIKLGAFRQVPLTANDMPHEAAACAQAECAGKISGVDDGEKNESHGEGQHSVLTEALSDDDVAEAFAAALITTEAVRENNSGADLELAAEIVNHIEVSQKPEGRFVAAAGQDLPRAKSTDEDSVEAINSQLNGEAKAVDQQGAPLKRKIDKKILMSLYGDDDQQKEDRQKETVVPAGHSVNGDRSDSGVNIESSEAEARAVSPDVIVVAEDRYTKSDVSANETSAATRVVLGDVLNSGEQTLGDVYASQAAETPAVIGNGVAGGLRKSIGINDKFLLIRDLFAGDAESYEKTLSQLEQFESIDDALLYIYDNFSWNADSDGAKMIMELLVRKLS